MHSRWLRTRCHFFESLKSEVQLIEGERGEELKRYETEYQKEFKLIWEVSNFKELIQKVAQSRFVLAGDFHYFYQSQKTHLRILRELVQLTDKNLVIVLEAFDNKHQNFIDQYLDGRLNWDTFLKHSQWQDHWGNLSPEGFKLILDWGKDKKVKVFGVNSFDLESLSQRDQFSGQLIDKIISKYEGALIYAICGDFHLAPAHLIQHIPSYSPPQDMRLFLNSEDLYFQLSEHAVEDQFDVLKHEDAYCLLSATPWVKLQSYVLHLQEMDDAIMAQQEDFDQIELDYTDYISNLLKIFISDFGIPDWRSHLEVVTASERSLKTLEDLILSEPEKEKLYFLISSQRNIIFPKEGLQFLAQPGVNKALCLVGEFIHSKMSQRESLLWGGPYFMVQRIWIGAVSYFFNLWVNPKVKTPQEKDLMNHLKALESSNYAQDVLKYAASFLVAEEALLARILNRNSFSRQIPILFEEGWGGLFKRRDRGGLGGVDFELLFQESSQRSKGGEEENGFFEVKNWKVQFEAASVLGKILGEKLYRAYKSGVFKREVFLDYLSIPLDSPKFLTMYNHVLMELKTIK